MDLLTGPGFENYNSSSYSNLVFQLYDYYGSNNSFPSALNAAQNALYMQAITDLKIEIPAYNYPTDLNLYPTAAMRILNLSKGCIVF